MKVAPISCKHPLRTRHNVRNQGSIPDRLLRSQVHILTAYRPDPIHKCLLIVNSVGSIQTNLVIVKFPANTKIRENPTIIEMKGIEMQII